MDASRRDFKRIAADREQEHANRTESSRNDERGLHLTRQSSAAASESATGKLGKYFNHDNGRKQAG